MLAELDHTELDQQVLAAQAAQASAEARLAELKAGPKPEVLAQAAGQPARGPGARQRARIGTRQQRRRPRSTSASKTPARRVDQAEAALQPDAQVVAAAAAAADAARAKLAQLRADPTKANDKAAMDAAQADVTKADAAVTAANRPGYAERRSTRRGATSTMPSRHSC